MFSLDPTFLLAAPEAKEPGFTGLAVYLAVTLGILFALLVIARKGFTNRVFTNVIARAFEQAFLFIENMCVGTIGRHGRKYVPFIMTFWLVIFVGNSLNLFMGFGPTASFSFNLAMALIAILYVQYEGIKQNGVLGHFGHFAGPKLPGLMVIVSGLIFVIEIISELMKNLSLSLRLYGNMSGGGMATDSLNQLLNEYLIPVGAFLLPIKLLTVVVQAMIFTLLTCVYLSLVTHEPHDPHDIPDHDEASREHPELKEPVVA